MSAKGKIGIVSSIIDDWGGSEDLWAKSIPTLQAAGFEIVFFRKNINRANPNYISLAKNNVALEDLNLPMEQPKPAAKINFKNIFKRTSKPDKTQISYNADDHNFIERLKLHQPDMIIISQGINFDGLNYAYLCQTISVPYVTITQKAVDFFWPRCEDRAAMAAALLGARCNYFVSKNNQRLTEEQMGIRLNNAQLVYNPVKKSKITAYPATTNGYHLACVGRLFIIDKGQDILLRILAKPKWQNRPIKISFIGKGPDHDGLAAMAKLLNIANIEFKGYVEDAAHIWENHHALILPSRSEGLPLVLVEAMAAKRTVIVTDAGDSAELVQEGVTGFTGKANEDSFEAAMDRAWEKRHNWEQMGKRASAYITENLPALPEEDFAASLIKVFYDR